MDMLPFLERKAFELRRWSVLSTTAAGAGHVTSALSAADIVAVLFFHVMRFDPHKTDENNDRFILSKGHAAPVLYAAWKELGFLTEQDLLKLRTINSDLEGHPTYRFSKADAATGSLGMGLSYGLGMAWYAHLYHRTFRTFVLLGDSELTEGSNWEGFDWAGTNKVNNLVAIVDVNSLGQRGTTMHDYDLAHLKAQISAFGWHVYEVDGHNIKALVEVFDQLDYQHGPIAILAKTVKGWGLKGVEGKGGFHGKALTREQTPTLLDAMYKRFSPRFSAQRDTAAYVPPKPSEAKEVLPNLQPPLAEVVVPASSAPRKVFGQTIAQLASIDPKLLVFDAEVSNSTHTDLVEAVRPQQFIEVFIAEQNMVGMGTGAAHCGARVTVATFACFFTRAFDQIRMTAANDVSLIFAGTHVGTSIGSDGVSQMGLEDMACFRTVPGMVVLYPSDGWATKALVEQAYKHTKSSVYLRLTRAELPTIYTKEERFVIGGSKLVRSHKNDQVLIVTAGITLHEALKAQRALEARGIFVAVLDLYSVKPLDKATLHKELVRVGRRLIVVEDHYSAGGMGEAVISALVGELFQFRHLCITTLPHSGSTADVLRHNRLDAQAIEEAVISFKDSAQ